MATIQKMRRPEMWRRLLFTAPLVTAACLLAGCYDLTRFKQERYECEFNQQGLVEIDFRDFKIGAEATVIFNDETVTMPIIKASDESFTLADDGLIIRVDRSSGTIRLTRGTRYRNVKCVKSKFRI
jgi:hypothetical protein